MQPMELPLSPQTGLVCTLCTAFLEVILYHVYNFAAFGCKADYDLGYGTLRDFYPKMLGDKLLKSVE